MFGIMRVVQSPFPTPIILIGWGRGLKEG